MNNFTKFQDRNFFSLLCRFSTNFTVVKVGYSTIIIDCIMMSLSSLYHKCGVFLIRTKLTNVSENKTLQTLITYCIDCILLHNQYSNLTCKSVCLPIQEGCPHIWSSRYHRSKFKENLYVRPSSGNVESKTPTMTS